MIDTKTRLEKSYYKTIICPTLISQSQRVPLSTIPVETNTGLYYFYHQEKARFKSV